MIKGQCDWVQKVFKEDSESDGLRKLTCKAWGAIDMDFSDVEWRRYWDADKYFLITPYNQI